MRDREGLTLLTGAGSVIGHTIARRISASRRLILSDCHAEPVEDTRRGCHAPETHLTWIQDLSEPDALAGALPAFLRDHQVTVGSLVHCAGLFRVSPLRLMTPEDGLVMLKINFLSAAELCRLLLTRAVNEAALQTVVFISSVAAMRGVRGYQYYSASKGALDAFMRSLAIEHAPRLRANSVLPGAVQSDRTDPAVLSEAAATHPLGLGRSEDVADAVEFLLSERARWITGQQFVVDGGWTCR